jgi:hypothetical protein
MVVSCRAHLAALVVSQKMQQKVQLCALWKIQIKSDFKRFRAENLQLTTLTFHLNVRTFYALLITKTDNKKVPLPIDFEKERTGQCEEKKILCL